jgi:hypothetical protein
MYRSLRLMSKGLGRLHPRLLLSRRSSLLLELNGEPP